MEVFASLLRESILVQAIITLAVILTVCVIYLSERVVQPELLAITMIIVGFYFGQRSSARSDTVLSKAQDLISNSRKDDQ